MLFRNIRKYIKEHQTLARKIGSDYLLPGKPPEPHGAHRPHPCAPHRHPIACPDPLGTDELPTPLHPSHHGDSRTLRSPILSQQCQDVSHTRASPSLRSSPYSDAGTSPAHLSLSRKGGTRPTLTAVYLKRARTFYQLNPDRHPAVQRHQL